MWWDSGCNKNQQNVCENYVASATLNLCSNNLSNSDVVSLRRQWMNYVTINVLCWTITILVCYEVGLKSFVVSVDYWDYMGSSLEIWLPTWSFLHLNSYNLVGSVTNLCSPSAPPSQPSLDRSARMWPEASSAGDGRSTPVVSTSQAPVAENSSAAPGAHTVEISGQPEQRPPASL